ncbi:hypothetical protein J3F83DRAFT_740846, partial [Trichoderma novae-zelandiae]
MDRASLLFRAFFSLLFFFNFPIFIIQCFCHRQPFEKKKSHVFAAHDTRRLFFLLSFTACALWLECRVGGVKLKRGKYIKCG